MCIIVDCVEVFLKNLQDKITRSTYQSKAMKQY